MAKWTKTDERNNTWSIRQAGSPETIAVCYSESDADLILSALNAVEPRERTFTDFPPPPPLYDRFVNTEPLVRPTAKGERSESPASVREVLLGARAAIWDSYYGKGLAIIYAHAIDKEIGNALAALDTARNAQSSTVQTQGRESSETAVRKVADALALAASKQPEAETGSAQRKGLVMDHKYTEHPTYSGPFCAMCSRPPEEHCL